MILRPFLLSWLVLGANAAVGDPQEEQEQPQQWEQEQEQHDLTTTPNHQLQERQLLQERFYYLQKKTKSPQQARWHHERLQRPAAPTADSPIYDYTKTLTPPPTQTRTTRPSTARPTIPNPTTITNPPNAAADSPGSSLEYQGGILPTYDDNYHKKSTKKDSPNTRRPSRAPATGSPTKEWFLPPARPTPQPVLFDRKWYTPKPTPGVIRKPSVPHKSIKSSTSSSSSGGSNHGGSGSTSGGGSSSSSSSSSNHGGTGIANGGSNESSGGSSGGSSSGSGSGSSSGSGSGSSEGGSTGNEHYYYYYGPWDANRGKGIRTKSNKSGKKDYYSSWRHDYWYWKHHPPKKITARPNVVPPASPGSPIAPAAASQQPLSVVPTILGTPRPVPQPFPVATINPTTEFPTVTPTITAMPTRTAQPTTLTPTEVPSSSAAPTRMVSPGTPVAPTQPTTSQPSDQPTSLPTAQGVLSLRLWNSVSNQLAFPSGSRRMTERALQNGLGDPMQDNDVYSFDVIGTSLLSIEAVTFPADLSPNGRVEFRLFDSNGQLAYERIDTSAGPYFLFGISGDDVLSGLDFAVDNYSVTVVAFINNNAFGSPQSVSDFVFTSSTTTPTILATLAPTTLTPTFGPTSLPSLVPTSLPSVVPTAAPITNTPTTQPTNVPTTGSPSSQPAIVPTTGSPTSQPTVVPTTGSPTTLPTVVPTTGPTVVPTTALPTVVPTTGPTAIPTAEPSSSTEFPTASTEFPTSSTEFPTSSTEFPTSSTEFPTSSTEFPTSSTEFPTSSTEFPTTETAFPTPASPVSPETPFSPVAPSTEFPTSSTEFPTTETQFPTTPAQGVVSFILYNADTDGLAFPGADTMPVQDDDVYSLTDIGSNRISIEVVTEPADLGANGRVIIELLVDGFSFNIQDETESPYFLFGRSGNDILSPTDATTTESYTVKAQAFVNDEAFGPEVTVSNVRYTDAVSRGASPATPTTPWTPYSPAAFQNPGSPETPWTPTTPNTPVG